MRVLGQIVATFVFSSALALAGCMAPAADDGSFREAEAADQSSGIQPQIAMNQGLDTQAPSQPTAPSAEPGGHGHEVVGGALVITAPPWPAGPSYPGVEIRGPNTPDVTFPGEVVEGPHYGGVTYIGPSYQQPAQGVSYAAPDFPAPTYPAPTYPAPVYPGPTYVGPTYVGPTYVGPTYVGPTYVGPTYVPATYPRPTYAPPTYAPPTYAPGLKRLLAYATS